MDIMALKEGFGGRVKLSEMIVFTRQFSFMVKSGLSMVACLDLLKGHSENPRLARIISKVKSAVEAGSPISNAMKRHPEVFDKMYVNLMQTAELDAALSRLSKHLERTDKVRRQLRTALVYPLVVMTVAVLVTIVMLWKVVPIFQAMYAEYGYPLPAITRYVVGACHTVVGNLPWIWAGFITVLVGAFLVMRIPHHRRRLDSLLLRLPLFRTLLRAHNATTTLGTLKMMLEAQIPLVQGLEHSAQISGNLAIKDSLMLTRDRVLQGGSLHVALKQADVLPAKAIQMVRVGVETDSLIKVLDRTAEYYEEEFDHRVKTMILLFEHLLYVVLGILCGGLMVAMYMPIFEMAGAVQVH